MSDSDRQVEEREEEKEEEKKKEVGGEKKEVERGQWKPIVVVAADVPLEDEILVHRDQLQQVAREGRNYKTPRQVQDNRLLDQHYMLKKVKKMVKEEYEEEQQQGREQFCCVLLL